MEIKSGKRRSDGCRQKYSERLLSEHYAVTWGLITGHESVS